MTGSTVRTVIGTALAMFVVGVLMFMVSRMYDSRGKIEITKDQYVKLAEWLDKMGSDSEYGKRLMLAMTDDKITIAEFNELKTVYENNLVKDIKQKIKQDRPP